MKFKIKKKFKSKINSYENMSEDEIIKYQKSKILTENINKTNIKI